MYLYVLRLQLSIAAQYAPVGNNKTSNQYLNSLYKRQSSINNFTSKEMFM